MVRYRSIIHDSVRWEGFAFREGDIVISTPAKCDTTWMQTIIALLVFQTPEFPQALDLISPWLDQSLRSRDSVVADLEAQEHRRFIKSHTPLDGLPWDQRVTYICVGRDPRDVAMSWDNHMANLDFDTMLALRDAAVGNDDLPELLPDEAPPAEDPVERFWLWVDTPASSGATIGSLEGMLHHLKTFWDARDRPNIVLLHYEDLRADLEAQMRRLAALLGIEVPEQRWPELVKAATFEEMRRRSAQMAPNSTKTIWRDTTRFFNRGTSGQWRELLDADDLRRYAARVAELADGELATWVHQGPVL